MKKWLLRVLYGLIAVFAALIVIAIVAGPDTKPTAPPATPPTSHVAPPPPVSSAPTTEPTTATSSPEEEPPADSGDVYVDPNINDSDHGHINLPNLHHHSKHHW